MPAGFKTIAQPACLTDTYVLLLLFICIASGQLTAARHSSAANSTVTAAPIVLNDTTVASANGSVAVINSRGGRGVRDIEPLPVHVVNTEPGWRLARATYFGSTKAIAEAYDPTRGQGSFGIINYGSCGYTNSDGSIPFARDAVAAASDSNPDYPGSCGRCYAVRCRTGTILDNDLKPLDIHAPYMTYLPAINNTVMDTLGHHWPGNVLESKDLQFTRCWNNSRGRGNTLVVRITDTCPCKQVLPANSPGVAGGGSEIRRQHWCCGGVQHFDLSYWAFEQLAHPVYGMMMVYYKPVECPEGYNLSTDPATLHPVPFDPGYISKQVVYGTNGTQPGWAWLPYYYKETWWGKPGAGVQPGDLATCAHLTAGGGVSFRCRECQRAGYQPLANATAIELVVRPNSNSTDPGYSSTPQNKIPPLKIYLVNEEAQKFCNAQVYLNETRPNATMPARGGGHWYIFRLPLSSFRCDYKGAMPEDITNISFEVPNEGGKDGFVCLAGLSILGQPVGPKSRPGVGPTAEVRTATDVAVGH